MKEPISIKEIFAIAIKRGTAILCTMLVFTFLAGAYQLYNQLQEAGKPENSKESIEARYQEAMDVYEFERAELENTIVQKEIELAQQQEYIHNAVIMKINALQKPVSNLVVSISNVDSMLLQRDSKQGGASAEYIIAKLVDYYETLWQNKDTTAELNNNPYKDIPESYLDRLISVTFTPKGIITISTTGEDIESANSLCADVYSFLNEMKETVSSATYPHDLSVLSKSDKFVVDTSLADGQKWRLENEKELMRSIEEMKAQLGTMTPPQREKGYSAATIVKETITWCVLGAVVGLLLGCLIVFIKFIVSDGLESSDQVETAIGAPLIGSLAGKGNLWNGIACHLVGEPIWNDREQAKKYISESIKNLLQEKSSVAILSTLPLSNNQSIQELISLLNDQGHSVSFASDAEKNPEALVALRENQYVIFAERPGKTTRKAVCALQKRAAQFSVTILGFVFV